MVEKETAQEKRKKILVRLLAAYFHAMNPYDERFSCACIAPDCVEIRCTHFWESLLSTYTAQDFRRMIESYMVATRKD